MKKILLLSFLILETTQLRGKSGEIIDLDPFEISEESYVYWGFSSKYNFKNPLIPNSIEKISDIEISSVFEGGIADLCGMQSGDRIIEINKKWDLNKNEMDELFSSISVGDTISIKIQKPDGSQVYRELRAIEYPKKKNISFRTNGISVKLQDAENWLNVGIWGKSERLKISYKDTPLLMVTNSTPTTFETLKDKVIHTVDPEVSVIFDKDLNYQIEK